MATDPNEVGNRFKYHTNLGEMQTFALNQVRERLRRVAVAFASSLPEGREKSLALTKLEEAMFWANAGIARWVPGVGDERLTVDLRESDVPPSVYLDILAKNAYNAYGSVTGFKNFRGDDMPAWESLGVTIQSAWVASVTRVREDISNSREDNA